MKSRFFIAFAVVVVFVTSCNTPTKTLKEQLEQLSGVVSVDSVFTDSVFTQQYEVYFEQPLDHKNPKNGSFNQRVIVSHKNFERPVVAELEGYHIWNGRAGELTHLLQSNQVNIEHRFFKDSKPDSIPWSTLTIWQAASDQHNIIKALQKIYKGKWLTTGISKGGQTTMFHRSFYASDVTASVPYVAPLNLAREDERIYDFLNSVGTETDRQRIYDFQCLCFENFDALLELLKKKSKEKKWSFQFGYEKALEYTILEYSFAYWQWGGFTSNNIPGESSLPSEMFEHLNNVAGFTFFEDASVKDNQPFFWAALTEIGMYGYKTAPFKKYLTDTLTYTFDFTLPEGTSPVFDKDAMQRVKYFLDTKASNMLFVVGGLDTWGATAYEPSENTNMVRMTLADGHHGTRIGNFNKEDREYMYRLLEDWMEVEINDIFEGN